MQRPNQRRAVGAFALGLLLAAAPAQAQRISLTDLQQSIADLEASIAAAELRSAIDDDPATGVGLRIAGTSIVDGRLNVLTRGMGEANGQESVLLGLGDTFSALSILEWEIPEDDPGVITAQLPADLAPGDYLLIVSNEVIPEGGGEPTLAVGQAVVTVGAQGPQGPQGPRGPDGEAGPQGPVGPAGAQGPEGPPGEEGEPGFEGYLGRSGPAGPAGPVGLSAATFEGRWITFAGTCRANRKCDSTAACNADEVAATGACGDGGTATNVAVVYAGAKPSNHSEWQCSVRNRSAVSSRTVNYGAYCVAR